MRQAAAGASFSSSQSVGMRERVSAYLY